MLVRRIARPLLAAPFIYGAIETFRNPQPHAQGARPVVQKVTEAADKQLPVQLPRDAELWVKVDAGVKLAAGTLFSLGRLPRLTALALGGTAVPTTLAEHRFWEVRDPQERANQLKHFLHTLGLLGGLLIAAVDTEGRPSVGWRARHAAKEVAEVTEKNLSKAQKAAAKAQKKAARQAAEARKQAKKQAAAAKKEAKKRARKVTS